MSAFAGRATGLFLLVSATAALSGCQATYDDTKGWANRLEASLLKAAHESFEGTGSEDTAKGGERAQSGLEWEEAESDPSAGSQGEAGAGMVQQTAAMMASPPDETPQSHNAPQPMPKTPTDAGAPRPAGGDPTGPTAGTRPEASTPKRADPPGQEIDPTGPSNATASADTPAPPKRKPSHASRKKADGGAKTAKTQKPGAFTMVIHLSSLRSEAAAKKEWQALQKAFPEQLSSMRPSFRRTEVADRGVFYRVLAGPLPSKQSARQICGALKAKKQYCQVMPAPPSA